MNLMARIREHEQADAEFRAALHGVQLHTGRGGSAGGGGLRGLHERIKARRRPA